MKIIKSNTFRGAYNGLVKCIKSNLGHGAQNIIIAPNRFTASIERALIESLEMESSFGIEVVSFHNLAQNVLGPKLYKCITEEGSIMLISSILSKNKDRLSCYGNVVGKDGLAEQLFKSLDVFRKSGIDASLIETKLEELAPYLKLKTSDIVFIYNEYLKALKDHFEDGCTVLDAFSKFISDEPAYAANINFYCTDIFEFSAPELRVLEQIDKAALSLTIAIPSGLDFPNRRIYPDKYIKRLKDHSESFIEEIYLDSLKPQYDRISKYLFSYETPNKVLLSDDKIILRKAKDKYDEIMQLALDIMQYVRENKDNRYRDFEVLVGDLASYSHEIKDIFGRYHIPFFIDENQKLIEQTKVKYMLAALSCVSSNFARRDVLDFVKNPLFYSELEDGENSTFIFENYVLKYNIDYSIFEKPFTLCSDNPKELEIPEFVRSRFVSLLSPLLKLENHADSSTYTNTLKEFLKKSDNAWINHVKMLTKISKKNYYSKCAEQVDKKLKEIFDEIEVIFKNEELSFEQFSKILTDVVKNKTIVLIPTSLDCVSIGSTSSRFMGKKNMYIVGATNANIPQRQVEESLVSPKDEEAYSGVNLEIVPSYKEKNCMHMYTICDFAEKSEDKLVISYPEMGGGEKCSPSSIISEIKHLFKHENIKGEKEDLVEEEINFDEFDQIDSKLIKEMGILLSTEDSCYHELLRNVISERLPNMESKIYSSGYDYIKDGFKDVLANIGIVPERINKDLINISGETSVSKLETFYSCPYKFFFDYFICLKKREDGHFEGTENGLVLHDMLEACFRDVRDGIVTKEEDIEEKSQKYFDDSIKEHKYERFMDMPEPGRILRRLKDEGVNICKNLFAIYKRSAFKPMYIEEKISKDNKSSIESMSLLQGNKSFTLKGIIDRVDVLDNNFVIIDYKTFKSAKLDLKDLYYGNKIQLYLYMKAVEESLKMHPVGVFYLPLYSSFDSSDDGRYKYKGHASIDLDVLKKYDDIINVDENKSIIPIVRDKQKNGILNENYHLTEDKFNVFGDYAKEVASKGAEHISEGYIKPVPKPKSCDYCDYADICSYKNQYSRNQNAQAFDAFLLKKEDGKNEER